jgi:hypothetical protein
VSLIANERTKLLAGFLNGIGTAMVGAGVIVPLVAFTYGIPGAAPGPALGLIGSCWLLAGLGLHLLARRLLGGLRE